MLNHSNDEVVVMPILNDKQIANFWKKVNMPEDKSLCWEWKGYMNEKGYGRIDINTKENGMKTYYSHRLAYFLQYGVDPLNKLICHSCDNPKCQNGNHLFIGTIQDNNADAAKKSRSLIVEGENNIKAKLTKETVKNILYDYYINKILFRLNQALIHAIQFVIDCIGQLFFLVVLKILHFYQLQKLYH